MEADPQPPPASPAFTPRQLELIAALPKVGNRFPLAAMFTGALIAMKQEGNPEAFVHAAQSLRELLEKFELMINVPLSGHDSEEGSGNMGSKAREYADKWSQTKSTSACFEPAAGGWAGALDPALAGFLNDTETFIRWYEAHPIYLKNKQTAVMVTLDPMFENLSQDEQERIALEWDGLKKFFAKVAHHRSVSTEKMENAVERLEIFLHRRLIPVEVENKHAILAFIQGIESP